jgi:ATP-binding cassette subfamily B protein
MSSGTVKPKGLASRVRKNLRQGMSLAWAASPKLLVRYTVLGIIGAIMPPIAVYLGALLVNRIAESQYTFLTFYRHAADYYRPLVNRCNTTCVGRLCGLRKKSLCAESELEAERRLLNKASKVDLGHFDNSDWFDKLARAKRDVSWRPGDLTWSLNGIIG